MSEPDSRFSQSSPGAIRPASGCGWKIPGCFLGCGSVVVVALLIVGGFAWWLLGSGEQHATEAAVGPESTGAFQIRDLGQDDDARAALGAVTREIRRRTALDPDTQVPSWLQVGDTAAFSTALAQVLPREGTLAFERVPGRDEPVAVLVLNLRGFTRPLRRLLEAPDKRPQRYRGIPVVDQPDGRTSYAMVDGTLVLADDPGLLRRTVDRLLDGTGEPFASRLTILEPLPEGALLSGGTDFEAGELAEGLRTKAEGKGEPPPVDPAALEGVRRLELVVDGLDPETIRFRVGLAAESPDSARRAADAVAGLLRDELDAATLAVAPRTVGPTAVLDAELTGWVEPFAARIAGGDAGLPAEAGAGPDG